MKKEFKKIVNVGGGVIGSSFSLIFASNNYDVIMLSRSESSVERTRNKINEYLDQLIENDVYDEKKKEEVLAHIHFSSDMKEAFEGCDYVQENWPENYETKHEFVKDFEQYAPDDAILATSTSGLLITEIAKYAKHPERIVGVHPYNPPHIIPLIEIVKGEKTSDEVAKEVYEFFTELGKVPVILNKEVKGYIGNRLQACLMREVVDLVEKDVVSLEDAEKALTFGPGIRWGIMGQAHNFYLGGGDKGLEGFMDNIGGSMELWLKDMDPWTEFPKDMSKIYKQMDEAIANRDPKIGNNPKDMNTYRTKMLIEILRLHGLM